MSLLNYSNKTIHSITNLFCAFHILYIPNFKLCCSWYSSGINNRVFFQIPQNVIHQTYGIASVAYRQLHYNNPNYISQSPSHQMAYPSAMQYQAISPMYNNQPPYQPPPIRQYPSYNQHGSPIKTYVNNSPKHIPYEPQITYSPTHTLYGPPVAVPGKRERNDTELTVSNF